MQKNSAREQNRGLRQLGNKGFQQPSGKFEEQKSKNLIKAMPEAVDATLLEIQ